MLQRFLSSSQPPGSWQRESGMNCARALPFARACSCSAFRPSHHQGLPHEAKAASQVSELPFAGASLLTPGCGVCLGNLLRPGSAEWLEGIAEPQAVCHT